MEDSAGWAAYRRHVEDVRRELLALPADQPVRLRKSTANLFRPRDHAHAALDARRFEGVLGVDVGARTAHVLGMTTYEELVDATLPHGLMPLLVRQLKPFPRVGAAPAVAIQPVP